MEQQRVFGIDIETRERCGAKVKVIVSIEDPAVIAHILASSEKFVGCFWGRFYGSSHLYTFLPIFNLKK